MVTSIVKLKPQISNDQPLRKRKLCDLILTIFSSFIDSIQKRRIELENIKKTFWKSFVVLTDFYLHAALKKKGVIGKDLPNISFFFPYMS